MKNLKKVLALVTVVAVLLTCVPAFAVSYSDVAANASYAEAVEMTSALGIFTGYEDGTFLPEKTITRAEAAAVITRFLGQEETAKAMAGTTQFTDMADAAWASGYVNYGVQKGYINGMGDGTYAPAAEVTYEQIVKMIVAALGYTIKAEANGGYPSGYLAVASQIGVTKGTAGSNGAASRATVARLAYNALTVPTMYISKYNSDGTKEYSEDGPAILYNELKVTEYVGVITDTYMIGLTDVEADKTVTVKYEEINGEEETGTETFLVGATDAADFLGYKVTVYVAENEETGDDEIIAVSAKGNQNDVVTVKGEDFTETGMTNTTSKVYYWKNKDVDKKASYVDLAAGVKVFANYEADAIGNVDFTALPGTATFISNDGDNDTYEYVIITTYTDEFVIDEIDAENFIIEGKTSGYLNMDPEDETTLYIIVKDGVAATFEDLAEGDVISQIGTSGIVVLNVSSASVSGIVSRISNGKYTIDGTQYEKASVCDDIAMGAEGIFYLNADGYIVDYEAEADVTGFYGYFIASDYKTSFGKRAWSVNFVDENGSEVTAPLAAKVKFGTGAVSGNSMKSEEIVAPAASEAPSAIYSFLNGAPTLFKYDTNAEGEITKIILAAGADAGEIAEFNKDVQVTAGNAPRYDAEENAAGTVAFADETVVFSVKGTVEDADDVTVTTVKAIFEDGVRAPFAYDVYDLDKNEVAAALVAVDAAATIAEDAKVLVVTEIGTEKFEDEVGYYITGIQEGKEVTYYVNDEAETYNGVAVTSLAKGDVVMLATGVEYVTDLVVKVDYDSYSAFQTIAPSKLQADGINEFIRTADEKDGNKIVFTENFVNAYGDTADTLSLGGKSASFTIVSAAGARVIVKAGSYNAINANSLKLTYDLYVRMVDGKILDVVAFEYPVVEATAAPATAAPTEAATAAPTEAATAAPTEAATAAPTEEVTAAPTEEVTAAPTEEVTAAPTEEVTAAPTEEVTAAPTEEATAAPGADPILTMNAAPYWNGSANGCADCTFAEGVLSMTKTFNNGGDALVWADSVIGTGELTESTTYTLKFTATVSGGVMHSWDGYSIKLRNKSAAEFEILRMVPQATGVAYTVGAGADTLSQVWTTGAHDYALVFTANSVTCYVDGAEMYTQAISFTGDMHCFSIGTGHNDATNCALTMSNFAVYEGDVH